MAELRVLVNKEFEFQITKKEISELDAVEISQNHVHILHEQKNYDAHIVSADFQRKTYDINLNNELFTVEIHDQLDQLIKMMGFEVGSSKQINEIKAPMPGLILALNVEEGQTVKENDPLLILEAMKMENVLSSPRDGVIASIHIAKGEAVDKNQLLIQFE
ncbi:acetyl-CoA carboxylase biotin carboxyl carrier protein subunit [Flavobacteriaceae bacterium F08102]|nr:acetyl-CoA carboxylase biotin carboxyl carrier protein subunit [Flavobacteriaceae bacterium F08102]